MPAATLHAMAYYGVVRGDTVRQSYDGACDTIDELRRLGLDMADIATTLERQGVAAFVESWNELIGAVTEKLKNQGATVDSEAAVKSFSGKKDPASTPAASLTA